MTSERGARRRYAAPQVVGLGGITAGVGADCGPGSRAQGKCNNGTGASWSGNTCLTGYGARSNNNACNTGVSPQP